MNSALALKWFKSELDSFWKGWGQVVLSLQAVPNDTEMEKMTLDIPGKAANFIASVQDEQFIFNFISVSSF